MKATALPTCLPSRPSPKAIWRPWNGWKPIAGSIATLMIFSGVRAATSSISTPPSVEAMKVTREVRAVDHHAEIELARDLAAVLDVDPAHLAARGPGLVGDERHAEHLVGELADLLDRPRELDAAALAAPAGVDLRLDHPDGPPSSRAAASASSGV